MLVFLGAIIPILITVGPLADFLSSIATIGESLGNISLIMWIPILIIAISAIVARKELPKSARQWWEFLAGSVPRFYTIGAILFFAIMASEVLASLGLATDVTSLLETLDLPLWYRSSRSSASSWSSSPVRSRRQRP